MMHSIKMENSPEGFDVEFCSGYGFVASNKTTTNGSLAYLLRCLKLQGSRESVMAFARGVAKTDDLARQHVALMDNKPYGSTKPTDDELTARAKIESSAIAARPVRIPKPGVTPGQTRAAMPNAKLSGAEGVRS